MKSYTVLLAVSLAVFVSCKKESETPKLIYETEKNTAEVNYFRLQTNFLLKKAILLVTLATPVDLADLTCIMKFAILKPSTF